MTSEIKLNATARTEFGKGAARRLRRCGQIPAVLYGHGTDPIHISLPSHDTQLALRQANALLAISIDGGEPQLALPKQIQRHPIKGFVEHADLIIVKVGEKVQVEIPITLVGEVVSGAVAMLDLNTISVAALATKIPTGVELNVDGFEPGAQIVLGDIKVDGAEVIGDPNILVASVALAPAEAAATEETAEGDTAAAEAVTEQ